MSGIAHLVSSRHGALVSAQFSQQGGQVHYSVVDENKLLGTAAAKLVRGWCIRTMTNFA
jgi:hypothetical protein